MELLTPWTSPQFPEGLVSELRREVAPHHQLFAKPVRPLAMASDRDDVLFEIEDGQKHLYAVVHLTWSGRQEISGLFPATQFFDSLDRWFESMRADHEDYVNGGGMS